MKNLYLISFLFIFLASCEKEETPKPEIPEWLEPRIEEIESMNLCATCSISRTNYQNQLYYHVYCGIWSCSHCEVYNSSGNLVDWSKINFEDFAESEKNAITIWSCSN